MRLYISFCAARRRERKYSEQADAPVVGVGSVPDRSWSSHPRGPASARSHQHQASHVLRPLDGECERGEASLAVAHHIYRTFHCAHAECLLRTLEYLFVSLLFLGAWADSSDPTLVGRR